MTKRTLSSHEVEILQQFENSAMLRDLEYTPGWGVYKSLAQAYIQAQRDLWETTNMDKDATWAAKVALQALVKFQKHMEESVETAKDNLNPDMIKRLIESVTIPQELLDGEIGLREL